MFSAEEMVVSAAEAVGAVGAAGGVGGGNRGSETGAGASIGFTPRLGAVGGDTGAEVEAAGSGDFAAGGGPVAADCAAGAGSGAGAGFGMAGFETLVGSAGTDISDGPTHAASLYSNEPTEVATRMVTK